MRSLFTLLQQQGAGKIVVILDINRTPGMLGEKGVGEETIAIAGKMGIACILSAHAHQFSHEAASLGHGMFTSALIEAIKYYRRDLTLDNLDQYLNERLPELSEHHWRPVQNPLIVVPMVEATLSPILPAVVSSGVNWNSFAPIAIESSDNNYLNGSSSQEVTSVMGNGTSTAVYTETSNNNGSTNGYSPSVIPVEFNGNNGNNGNIPYNIQESENEGDFSDDIKTKSQALLEKILETPWQLKGGIAIIFLILALLGLNKAINKFNPSTPVISESTSTENNNTTNTTQNTIPQTTIPANVPSSDSIGKEYLKQAKASFNTYQASDFSHAINEARKVPQNDPYYQEAVESISRWSHNIWDIAQSRADKGNFTTAIAAAQLIPSDQIAIYNQAQNAIAQWKQTSTQQINNNKIIQEAKSLLIQNQASSYIKAMQILEKIPPEENNYIEAQNLRQEWSRKVYLIAHSRASRGKFQLAIQTASLVPEDSNSYENAQKAIARWKEGKK